MGSVACRSKLPEGKPTRPFSCFPQRPLPSIRLDSFAVVLRPSHPALASSPSLSLRPLPRPVCDDMKALARRSSFSHRRSHDVLNVGGTSSTASSSLRSYTPETDAPPPPPLKPRMSISIVVRYMPLDSWVTLSIWEDTTVRPPDLRPAFARLPPTRTPVLWPPSLPLPRC